MLGSLESFNEYGFLNFCSCPCQPLSSYSQLQEQLFILLLMLLTSFQLFAGWFVEKGFGSS